MTLDEIIKLAREAGCEIRNGHIYHPFSLDQMLKRFASLVAKQERESCAAFLEGGTESSALSSDPFVRTYTISLLKGLANSIRAKGDT